MSGRRAVRHWWWLVVWLLAGFTLVGLLTIVTWRVLYPQDRPPQRFERVIPAGTATRVRAGESLAWIAADMVFVQGDTLVLRNEDQASHQFGPLWIPAGTTAQIALDRPTTLTYLCTLHPAGAVELQVRPRVSPLMLLVPPLILGFPLGAAAGLAWSIAARLNAS